MRCTMRWVMVSVALSFSLLCTPVSAVVIVHSFSAEVPLGSPFAGETGTGTFSYDDDVLTGLGFESITPSTLDGMLSIMFTILGQDFTEADDIDFPDFPQLDFFDGTPNFIDFVLSEDPLRGPNPISIDAPRVVDIEIISDLSPGPPGGPDFTAEALVFITAPEPGTLALFALGGLIYVRRLCKAG